MFKVHPLQTRDNSNWFLWCKVESFCDKLTGEETGGVSHVDSWGYEIRPRLTTLLVCCSGWAAFPGGPVGTVKSFGEPHSVGISNCLVGAMWPNWRCSHVSGGSCALCYPCRDFQYPELLGTFWGWLMGPRSGLSLRGGTGYPAPHWNLELGQHTYRAMNN